MGLENRLKDKAWKEVEPKLRQLAHDPKALSELRSSINNWFNEIRGNLSQGIARIISIEQQNLTRLDALTLKSGSKGLLVERLDTYKCSSRRIHAIKVLEHDIDAEMHAR